MLSFVKKFANSVKKRNAEGNNRQNNFMKLFGMCLSPEKVEADIEMKEKLSIQKSKSYIVINKNQTTSRKKSNESKTELYARLKSLRMKIKEQMYEKFSVVLICQAYSQLINRAEKN